MRVKLTRSEIASDGLGGWTSSYTQSYKGVPVFASRIKAHVNADGALTAVSGYAAPDIDLLHQPAALAGCVRRPGGRDGEAGPRPWPATAALPRPKDLKVVGNTLMIYRTEVTKGELRRQPPRLGQRGP